MSGFPLLEQASEDSLHLTRLLNVEERPFARVSKRLLSRDALLRSFPAQLPTPPPDEASVDEAAAAVEAERQKQEQERRQWRDDVMLDFANLESTFIRVELLKKSNEKERERYAAEKINILETADAVRKNTADLRIQLSDAQRTLALRKEYDALANKITSNRMLKPREEQHANLEKLNAEIADLEQEGHDYAQTWAERKEQFDKIMSEGRQMLRIIRGEKDESEKEEGMEDADEAEGNTDKDTPRPDMGGATPLPQDGETSSASTHAQRLNKELGLSATSGAPSVEVSAAPTPARDSDMVEAEAEAESTPQPGPASDVEEGEAAEDSLEDGEHMDTT
ncbi:hypothetical protein AAFC00_001147 [Neodothiora populina]|uniref:Tho complex subunit 7 n=1 Tax=Neodothiora populina TaxID=2781224 RepID=A0ABR3PMX3_9PEZI